MNSIRNKAYRGNNETILSFKILHEKIYPTTIWIPKSREKLANLLIIIISETIH